MGSQPAGRVTLYFSDIEGSTRLLQELGPEGYRAALAEHRRVLREAFARNGGFEVDHEGDAFFVAFQHADAAVTAAMEGQAALASGPIRVRMGLHTGEPLLDPPKYVGVDVHLAARIMSAGHGGQVLLSKATRELVHGEISDLGEHRLKDMAEPVWLFQLGSAEFPPLKTISNTNLPRPASSFVGREEEVSEVVSLLQSGARLVSLTGPGGSGKTRLAIEAAAELVPEYRSGVFWVGLAALRDPSLVLETIGRILGARDDPATHISERELLLVLDNFEQVVEAAPELSTLLESCKNLSLIVTSRELLRVQGEVGFPVPPLAKPEAIELFATRARAEPDETVADLCSRLDNLPLAIELAAAQTTVLTPAQILERLSQRLDLLRGGRDADPRQATLRATIEWSHELLAPEEQHLFARLAVFAGGCTLEAAQEVAAAELRTLQALVEKSLVRHTADRFWMLETIHEYASERFRDLPDAELIEQRHTDFSMALARAAEVGERGADQAEWWDRLEADLDNLRASLDRARVQDEVERELELATLLKRFWHSRGHIGEGKTRIEDALARAPLAPVIVRARGYSALGFCAFYSGGGRTAFTAAAEEAFRLFSEAGDQAGVARAMTDLGTATVAAGDRDRGRALLEQARALATEVGDLRYASFAAHNLADLALVEGDYPYAVELSTENLAAARATDDPDQAASATLLLGYALAGVGRMDDARALALETLVDTDPSIVVSTEAFELLAIADLERGRASRAAMFVGLAGRLRHETGEIRASGEERLFAPACKQLEALMGAERLQQTVSDGAALTLEEAIALAGKT